jgi:hypothetical protein
MKKKLWIFGDSFSVPFKKQSEGKHSYDYVKYKGYPPKVFSEIISETYNLNLKDFSISGSSNQRIFNSLVSNLNEICDEDILIFGWTQNTRFDIATKDNNYFSVITGGSEGKNFDFIDVPFDSLVDVSSNRLRYSIFWSEVISYIRIINYALKNNKVYHWTWVNPSNDFKLNNGNYQKEFYKLLIPFKKYPSITEETNNVINDFHWGELGHKLFVNDVINHINLNKLI